MSKFLSILGFLMIIFLVVSNYLDFKISNSMVIVIAAISAIFICISVLTQDKNINNTNIKKK